eukprot:3671812-Rhodomonas_salina.1
MRGTDIAYGPTTRGTDIAYGPTMRGTDIKAYGTSVRRSSCVYRLGVLALWRRSALVLPAVRYPPTDMRGSTDALVQCYDPTRMSIAEAVLKCMSSAPTRLRTRPYTSISLRLRVAAYPGQYSLVGNVPPGLTSDPPAAGRVACYPKPCQQYSSRYRNTLPESNAFRVQSVSE